MKILICHNTYQIAGGEDTVVAAEKELLESHGHDVKLYEVSNNQIKGLFQKVKTGLFVAHSQTAKAALKQYLEDFPADIVHFHNTFPLLTPSVYDACQELNIPVIQTLHNYRTICPGALLMRSGSVCEKCISGSPYNASVHGCYRNSKVQSLAVSHMVSHHKRHNTWNTKVDRFIALTKFAKQKFTEAGFNPNLIRVKSNFINLNKQEALTEKKSFALFVGRLSEEKGIQTLIQAFKNIDVPLKIAGDGPLLEELQSHPLNNIEILGRKDSASIHQLMKDAQFLVMPSQWYEGFPMVIVEAFAHGLPVLCSKLGAMEEVVIDGKTGSHFPAGNNQKLSERASMLYNSPRKCFEMGVEARSQYNQHYNADVNYQQLISIYQEAIDDYAQ